MDQQKVKDAAEHMHASIKAGSVTINFDDLIQKMRTIGLTVGEDTLKKLLDDVLFPWLNTQLSQAATQNMLFGLGLPLVQALQMIVDQQLAKLPKA